MTNISADCKWETERPRRLRFTFGTQQAVKMRRSIFVLLCASSFSTVFASPYTACESKGKITELNVKDCSNDVSQCILKRDTTAQISITFSPGEDVESLKVAVFGLLNVRNVTASVPYMMDHTDGCKDSNLNCPLKKEDSVTYSQSFPVLMYYPQMELVVRWTLVNPSTNHVIVCAEIPVKIQ